MSRTAIASTTPWHVLALALTLASGCDGEPADGGDGPEQQVQPTRIVEDSGGQEPEPEGCAFELDQLLERADVRTLARANCGGFRADGRSSTAQGIVDCFLEQSVEKNAAVEFRFVSGGIDSGPVTHFVADGAGSIWSVEINCDPFGSSHSGSAAVASCTSIELAGSGYVCKESSLLYSCNGPR